MIYKRLDKVLTQIQGAPRLKRNASIGIKVDVADCVEHPREMSASVNDFDEFSCFLAQRICTTHSEKWQCRIQRFPQNNNGTIKINTNKNCEDT